MKFFIMLKTSLLLLLRGLEQKYISFWFILLYSINISILPPSSQVELCVPIIIQYEDIGKELGNAGFSSGLFDLEEG